MRRGSPGAARSLGAVLSVVMALVGAAAVRGQHVRLATLPAQTPRVWPGRYDLWAEDGHGGRVPINSTVVDLDSHFRASAADGSGASGSCRAPAPARAAELGRTYGLGAPLAAGTRLLILFNRRAPVPATITAALVCSSDLGAELRLDGPGPLESETPARFLAMPAATPLGAWQDVGISEGALTPAQEGAVAAQFNARLPEALAEVLRNPEVARQRTLTAEIDKQMQARGRAPFGDPIGTMAQAAVGDASGLKLHVLEVRFAAGGAFEFVRADWYVPCPGRCGGGAFSSRGIGASLEGWFAAPPSLRLLSLDSGPLLSKFNGWGAGIAGDQTKPEVVVSLADGRAVLLTIKEMGEGEQTDIYLVDPAHGPVGMRRIYSVCECGD